VFITICLGFLCLFAAAQELPADLRIVPPGAGVSPRLAQLSGIWEGAWEYSPKGPGAKNFVPLDVIGWGVKIAILEINPPKAKALYATSGSPGNPGKCFQVEDAAVSGDAIMLKFGQAGEKKTVTLSPSGNPGVAHATMQSERAALVHKATLRKQEGRRLAEIKP